MAGVIVEQRLDVAGRRHGGGGAGQGRDGKAERGGVATERQRLPPGHERRGVLVERAQGVALEVPRVGKRRPQGDRLGVTVHRRLFIPAQLLQRDAAPAPGLRVLAVDGQRSAELFFRLVVPVHAMQGVAAGAERLGVTRAQRQRPFRRGQGLLVAAHVVQADGEMAQRFRIVGAQRQCPLVAGARVVQPPQLAQAVAAVAPRQRVRRRSGPAPRRSWPAPAPGSPRSCHAAPRLQCMVAWPGSMAIAWPIRSVGKRRLALLPCCNTKQMQGVGIPGCTGAGLPDSRRGPRRAVRAGAVPVPTAVPAV